MPRTTQELEDFVNSRLEVLIAEANEAGFGTSETLAGLGVTIHRQRQLYEQDPDPADEPELEASRSAIAKVPGEALGEPDPEDGASAARKG